MLWLRLTGYNRRVSIHIDIDAIESNPVAQARNTQCRAG